MDASPPSPRSGENVSDAPTVSEFALQQTIEGHTDLFRDYVTDFQQSVRDQRDGMDRADLLDELERLEAELQVMRTLLEEYPEEDE
jgi:hypothetical protein